MPSRFETFLLLLLLAFSLQLCGCAATRAAPVSPDTALLDEVGPLLDGDWEGVLTVNDGQLNAMSVHEIPLRLSLQQYDAVVSVQDHEAWVQVKPGRFHVNRLGPNAVIFSVSGGRDTESLWAETWAFVITSQSENSLFVQLGRAVNNLDLPETSDHKRFGFTAHGVLHRLHRAEGGNPQGRLGAPNR